MSFLLVSKPRPHVTLVTLNRPERQEDAPAGNRRHLGLSYLLPRAIGTTRAFEIMLTGRDVDAAEAERVGLVSRVCGDDELLEACYETAARISSLCRVGVELAKRAAMVRPGRRQPGGAHAA